MRWLWIAGGIAVVWAVAATYAKWRVGREVDRIYAAWRGGTEGKGKR